MFQRLLISFLVILLTSGLAMRAEANCTVLDEATVVLSEARQGQNTNRNEAYSIKFKEAFARLTSEGVLNDELAKAHPLQNALLSSFLTDLDVQAQNKLPFKTESEFQELSASLRVIERFWNCVPREEINPVEEYGQQGSMETLPVPDNQLQEDRIRPFTAVSGQSNERGVTQNVGGLRPAKISRPNPLQVDYMVLIAMIFVAVLGMTYIVRKRPKPRETRRIIQTPVRIRLGREVYDMRIVDITANGCKIEHDAQITKQQKLQVELNSKWYLGHIKWQNNAFAGVKFHRALDQKTFNSVVKASFASNNTS